MLNLTNWLSSPLIGDSSVLLGYIDPGTGSLILQALAAGLVTSLLFFKSLSVKVRGFFSRLGGGGKEEQEDDQKDA